MNQPTKSNGSADAKAQAAAAAATAAALKKKAPPPLRADDLEFAESKYNRHTGTAPAGYTPEELSDNAGFWAVAVNLTASNGMKFLQPRDDIRLEAADGAWIADFVVMRNRSVKLWTGPAVYQDGARKVGQVRQLPQGFVFVEAGPRDPMPGIRVMRESDGKLYESSGGVPWPNEEAATREFLDHAMFRGADTPRFQPG